MRSDIVSLVCRRRGALSEKACVKNGHMSLEFGASVNGCSAQIIPLLGHTTQQKTEWWGAGMVICLE